MADGRTTHVRVWAPAHKQVAVAHGPTLRSRVALEAEAGTQGYFSGRVEGLGRTGRPKWWMRPRFAGVTATGRGSRRAAR